MFRRDVSELRQRAEETIAMSEEMGFAHWVAEATILRGWAAVEEGDAHAGCAEIEEGLAAWKATGATVFPYQTTLLALAQGRRGRLEQALDTLGESFTLTFRTGAKWWLPESYRAKAELLRLLGEDENAEAAEASFNEAIAAARKLGAKVFELRAVAGLYELLERREGDNRALPMLEQSYRWFTEGFDTPDLKEAKAILDRTR